MDSYKYQLIYRADLKYKGAISTSSSQLWFHRLSLPSGPLCGDFLFDFGTMDGRFVPWLGYVLHDGRYIFCLSIHHYGIFWMFGLSSKYLYQEPLILSLLSSRNCASFFRLVVDYFELYLFTLLSRFTPILLGISFVLFIHICLSYFPVRVKQSSQHRRTNLPKNEPTRE